jgi:myo-inositol-1(or 4)-monophosphatase
MLYKNFITESLKTVADISNSNFGQVSSVTKAGDNNQVLTETDVAIGKLLISRIQQAYPEHNIIDEEAGVIDKKSQYTWVIDPIDGTSNFAQGIPLYGNMLGLLKDDMPIAGGIAMPYFNEIYVAEKGQGAYCNEVRIYATKETNLLSTLIAYTIDGHQENPEYTRQEAKLIGEIVLDIRNLRASGSCFDVVMVAKGKYGGYVNQTSKIWDNVAAQILLEEAGCTYTDLQGNKIDYTSPLTKAKGNFTFCTAPQPLHHQLQKIIHHVI